MTVRRLLAAMLGVAALAVSASAGQAGSCALCAAHARSALRPSLPQSIAAQLHFQPTVASEAAAEAQLAAAGHGMARPRARRCPC